MSLAVAGDGRRLTGGGWAWRSAAFARHQPHPRGAPAPAEAANSASGFARVKSERKFFTRTPVVLGLKKGKINYVHFFLFIARPRRRGAPEHRLDDAVKSGAPAVPRPGERPLANAIARRYIGDFWLGE